MPLIPFPDVPSVPGVPQLPLPSIGISLPTSLANLTSIAPADDGSGMVNGAAQWQIVDTNGSAIIIPDSVIDFEYRGESKIPRYPIELGGFEGYNKVLEPFDTRLTISCGGNGEMAKADFLSAIDGLRTGLTMCSIVTPDASYPNCNLIHVDYRRQAKQGVSLILAQLWFQQVMTGRGAPAAAQPDGAVAQQNGHVSPTPPTAAQSSAINTTSPL